MLLEKEMSLVSDEAERSAVHLVVSRWIVLLFAVIIGVPWLVIAGLFASRIMALANSKSPGKEIASQVDASAQSPVSSASNSANDPLPNHWTPGKAGPWGQIESMLIAIDVPDEFNFVPASDRPPVRWSFPGYTKEKVLATLRAAGVPEGEVTRLDQSAKWTSNDGVESIEPGDPLILSLTPHVRSTLYAILVVFPQNAHQIDPIWFRPGQVDWRLADSGLAPESIALFKRLLYAQGKDMLLFADFDTAMRSLASDAERKRLMKVISRKRAVLARVRLDSGTDLEKLSQYWGVGGRRKDLLPLLDALHRVEQRL